MRRAVLQELGGFETSLRAVGAEGCEDLLLQLRIAARYQFGEIPEYLVGYRRRPGSMSSDTEQMLKSGMLAVSIALAECSDTPHLSRDAILIRYGWQRLRSAARRGEIDASIRQLFRQFRENPLFAMILLGDDLAIALPKGFRSVVRAVCYRIRLSSGETSLPQHFYEFDPVSDIGRRKPILMSLVFDRLARFDHAYRPKPGATLTALGAAAASEFAARMPPDRAAPRVRRI